MDWVDVMASEDLAEPGQRSCKHGFTRLLLCRDDRGVHAVENICPHARQPIEGGRIDAGAITCPRHGARFDLGTGRPLNGITCTSLRVFAARVRDGRIEVDLE